MRVVDWISSDPELKNLLPFCHTTKWKHLDSMVREGILAARHSSFPPKDFTINGVPAQEAVYLFYGAPFFMYEQEIKPKGGAVVFLETTAEIPVGILLDPKLADHLDAIYPFDTGAALSGWFSSYLSFTCNDDIERYRVPCSTSSVGRLVTHYYLTNARYCDSDHRDDLIPAHYEEEGLLKLFGSRHGQCLDVRSKAFEAHSKGDINIADWIIGVILPKKRSKLYPNFVQSVQHACPRATILYYRDVRMYDLRSLRELLINEAKGWYEKGQFGPYE